MKLERENNSFVMYVDGRISNLNAAAVEKNINDALKNVDVKNLVLDVGDLQFISSAGVRIILKLAKNFRGLTIRNAEPEVYGVLDMTGLTKIISVTRALRDVSPEGAEIIGRGYAGTIYRLSDDLILKLYNVGIPRELVENEKEHAEKAFLNGIPTAVSYDVVKHGDQFGIVFELMNAKNLAEVFAAEPENFDDLVRRAVECLRRLHQTPFESGTLPAMKDNYKWHLRRTTEFLSPEEIQTLCELPKLFRFGRCIRRQGNGSDGKIVVAPTIGRVAISEGLAALRDRRNSRRSPPRIFTCRKKFADELSRTARRNLRGGIFWQVNTKF